MKRFLTLLALATLLAPQLSPAAGFITLDRTSKTAITATIRPDAADIGRTVSLWMGAIYQGTLYLRSGNGWVAYSGGAYPVAGTATLASATAVTVVDQMDISAMDGLELYVGYGGSEQEMTSTPGRLAKIFTVASARDTSFGRVQGAFSSSPSSYVWLGIPYAAPPVGARRWRAPVDPAPWTGVRQATGFRAACPQIGAVTVLRAGTIPQDEDCLTLNIWSPTSGDTNLPVLVFVHGGSNTTGYAGNSLQWGGTLAAEQNVVVVTINYRLNVFGWLYHPALQTGDPAGDSGNYGTLDIIQALKFVKNNIARFGGDPNNVTLSGQSAGASNTWSLMTSPLAAGLFHKAVPMTGTLPTGSTASGLTFATNFLRRLVINDGLAVGDQGADAYIAAVMPTNAQKSAYLYGKSTSDLLAAFNALQGTFPTRFLDGVVLPPNLNVMLTGAYLNNVPVISGVTNEEGKFWGYHFSNYDPVRFAQYGGSSWSAMLAMDPEQPGLTVADIIPAAYLPAGKPFKSCADTGYNGLMANPLYNAVDSATWCFNASYTYPSYFNTAFFWQGQTTALVRYQPLQPKTYAYNFKWARQPEPMRTALGACHACDIPFFFGNVSPDSGHFTARGFSQANRGGREALSARMRQAIGNFMRTGDPNGPTLGAVWLPWSPVAGGAKRLVLDADDNAANVYMTTDSAPVPVQ